MGGEGLALSKPQFVHVTNTSDITATIQNIENLIVEFGDDQADLDTNGGLEDVDNHPVFAIGLPGAGGHRVGGTNDDPLTVRQKTGDAWTVATGLNTALGAVQTAVEAMQAILGDVHDDAGDRTRVIVTSSVLPTGAATQATLAEFDASFGDTTDASTVAGGAGTAQAKLRKMTSQLNDLANLIGEVQANPTSNTLQDRLKRSVTALEIMDDWDESDRAKVNPVVGQAGVEAGAGAVTAKTQRVAIATDAPLPSGSNEIGTVRPRSEDNAFLHHATGSATVPAGSFGTVASIIVPAGKKLKLIFAEGDFENVAGLGQIRGIRIQQASNTRATVFVGADQPNPDIEGLILENSSGSPETWGLQTFNGSSVTARTMFGWFSWVEVSD